jgi:hypothetical protein
LEDPTTALAALMVIAETHRDLFVWAFRTTCEPSPEPLLRRRRRKANGGHKLANADPHRKPRGGDRRLAKRETDDQALVEAMRRNTEATIGELATVVGKSRTSIVSALHRLRAAGRAQPVDGKWRLTEEPPPREPAPRWVKPPSAVHERVHA